MNDTVMISTAANPLGQAGPATLASASSAAGESISSPSTQLFPQAQGESDRAFEAFRVYLELGSRRRYSAVATTVGTSLRSIKRWAIDFDWRGRIKTYAAHSVGQYAEIQNAVHREDLLDAATRTKTFRDRQYTLVEAMLDTAERYRERVDESDLG